MSHAPAPAHVLPCPFCGETRALYLGTTPYRVDGRRWSYVYCFACLAKGPHCQEEARAIAAWDRRAPFHAMTIPQAYTALYAAALAVINAGQSLEAVVIELRAVLRALPLLEEHA